MRSTEHFGNLRCCPERFEPIPLRFARTSTADAVVPLGSLAAADILGDSWLFHILSTG